MTSSILHNGELLLELERVSMPFGKYRGRSILELPETYLLWFQQEGFPDGKLGGLMALALEIRINGLEKLVKRALGATKKHN